MAEKNNIFPHVPVHKLGLSGGGNSKEFCNCNKCKSIKDRKKKIYKNKSKKNIINTVLLFSLSFIAIYVITSSLTLSISCAIASIVGNIIGLYIIKVFKQ